ncbi:MAG TPA: hydrogen-dependent growth transcriptional repressor [Malonomonas sp.]
MGRRANNAKKFIISCRVNTEEMDLLQNLATESGSSISDLLRKCLTGLQDNGKNLQMSA